MDKLTDIVKAKLMGMEQRINEIASLAEGVEDYKLRILQQEISDIHKDLFFASSEIEEFRMELRYRLGGNSIWKLAQRT